MQPAIVTWMFQATLGLYYECVPRNSYVLGIFYTPFSLSSQFVHAKQLVCNKNEHSSKLVISSLGATDHSSLVAVHCKQRTPALNVVRLVNSKQVIIGSHVYSKQFVEVHLLLRVNCHRSL